MTVEPSHRDTGIRFLLVAACVVVIIAGLRAAAPIILPFLIAVFLAVVNVPLMNWLIRNRVPKPIAVVLTILTAVSIVGILVGVMATSLNQFSVVAPTYQERLQELFASITILAERYGVPADQLTACTSSVRCARPGWRCDWRCIESRWVFIVK